MSAANRLTCDFNKVIGFNHNKIWWPLAVKVHLRLNSLLCFFKNVVGFGHNEIWLSNETNTYSN